MIRNDIEEFYKNFKIDIFPSNGIAHNWKCESSRVSVDHAMVFHYELRRGMKRDTVITFFTPGELEKHMEKKK